jgi:uncharacterized integral membrane protein (TIGR00697 family)
MATEKTTKPKTKTTTKITTTKTTKPKTTAKPKTTKTTTKKIETSEKPEIKTLEPNNEPIKTEKVESLTDILKFAHTNDQSLKKQKVNEKHSYIFTLLCICFVTILILSNISASNTFHLTSFISLSAAELLFPLSYIIGDLIVEVYGFKKARKVIITALAICVISIIFLYLTTLFPSNYIEYNTVFGSLMGGVLGITIASILAYFVGSFTNAYIMDKLKQQNKGSFFNRAIVSTVAGEILDTLVFITFCCIFASQFYVWDKLLPFVLTISLIKIAVEIIIFPLTKYLLKVIKRKEGIE